MKKSVRFSPELQERAVRMVVEAQGQHDAVSGHQVHRRQDRLHVRDAAALGAPA